MEGKEINSFVWLGGTAVKKRKMKETNSFMAHYILSSQIERKRREYLWWDPPIDKVCFPPIFSYKPNKEKKKIILSLPSPLPSLPPFPFPSLPSPFCFPKHSVSVETAHNFKEKFYRNKKLKEKINGYHKNIDLWSIFRNSLWENKKVFDFLIVFYII